MAGGTPGPKYQALPQDSYLNLHPDSLPLSKLQHSLSPQTKSWCPKLSRYKIVMAVFVVVVTMVLMVVTCLQRQQPYLSTCLQPPPSISPSHTPSLYPSLPHEFGTSGGMTQLRYSHTRRQLPQCLIIGARKAGTRALLFFLNLHSQIRTAGHEIHFFDKNYHLGLEWYRKNMPFSFKDQVTVEKTPAYFVESEVPERVYRMNSSIKLLLIVRDPIDRTMSDYLQISDNKIKRQKPVTGFERLVLDQESYEINRSYPAIKRSIYIRHLTRWLHYFPLHQIHFVDADNLVARPWQEIAKVEEFLGLEHQITRHQFTLNTTRGFYCIHVNHSDHCLSADKGRRHPDIDPFVLKKLVDFFTPFNQRFFKRIGRQFAWRHWT